MKKRFKTIDIGLGEPVVVQIYDHLELEQLLDMFEQAMADEDYETCAGIKAEAESRGYIIEPNK